MSSGTACPPGAHSASRGRAMRSPTRHVRRAGAVTAHHRARILPLARSRRVAAGSRCRVAGWNLSGGRLLVMETPSMCPVVCVGSLVADRPLVGRLHVGELITFHPPEQLRRDLHPRDLPHLRQRGDPDPRASPDASHDPWLITRSDIVGEVELHRLGAGLAAEGPAPSWRWACCSGSRARGRRERTRRSWDRGWMTVLVVPPAVVVAPVVVRSTVVSARSMGRITAPGERHGREHRGPAGLVPGRRRQPAVCGSSADLGHVSGTLTAMGNLRLHEAWLSTGGAWRPSCLRCCRRCSGSMWHVLRGRRGGAGRRRGAGPRRAGLFRCRPGELHLLARLELRSGPVPIDPPDRVLPADRETVAGPPTRAVSSSMPTRTASGGVRASMRSASPGTQCSKRSKWGRTTSCGTTASPSPPYRSGRTKSSAIRLSAHAPAEQPARAAPACQAARIARHTAVPTRVWAR